MCEWTWKAPVVVNLHSHLVIHSSLPVLCTWQASLGKNEEMQCNARTGLAQRSWRRRRRRRSAFLVVELLWRHELPTSSKLHRVHWWGWTNERAGVDFSEWNCKFIRWCEIAGKFQGIAIDWNDWISLVGYLMSIWVKELGIRLLIRRREGKRSGTGLCNKNHSSKRIRRTTATPPDHVEKRNRFSIKNLYNSLFFQVLGLIGGCGVWDLNFKNFFDGCSESKDQSRRWRRRRRRKRLSIYRVGEIMKWMFKDPWPPSPSSLTLHFKTTRNYRALTFNGSEHRRA